MNWKLTALLPKPRAEAALLRQEETLDWPADIVVSACEIDEQQPDDWKLEAWLDHEPDDRDTALVAALFDGAAADLAAEKLPDIDWVSESQKGAQPIRAGRFHVHTPHFPPEPDAVNFVIPAAQAFGTGQHETTAGCLAMLDTMRSSGVRARNVADIGTGTGLLAFGAMKLWPRASVIASDIDPVCAGVVAENEQLNNLVLDMIIADGMDDPALQQHAPFDLLIANILAGPLVDLAPEFALTTVPGGHLVLAGLLETQEASVRAAYWPFGFRLRRRLVKGDWSILWLTKSRVR